MADKSLDMTHRNGHSDPALPERNLADGGMTDDGLWLTSDL